MKHIRLFEGFETEDYYIIIDNEYYYDELQERVEMSNVTINRIKELFSEQIDHPFTHWDIDIGNMLDVINIWDHFPTQNIQGKYEIQIFETIDEYYYIYINNYKEHYTDYYKCDQFEGLVKLLKDKSIILP